MQQVFAYWHNFSLSKQYMMASAVVLVTGMLVIGSWVSHEIERGVGELTAFSTALYMDSFVAPLVQELAAGDDLTVQSTASLKKLMDNTAIGKRIVSIKIWRRGGVIAYSSERSIIGRRFVESANLKRAWRGAISAEFDPTVLHGGSPDRDGEKPVLELYSPIRERGTDRIIAVGEFYQNAKLMEQELLWASLKSWMVVAVATFAVFLSLSGIVRRGSRTIVEQRSKLEERIAQLSHLRRRVALASMGATEINERFLRRISADLHDGPAQLLGLALLKLGSIRSSRQTGCPATGSEVNEIIAIENVLGDAMKEIRDLSSGLALPELEGLRLTEVLHKAIDIQERRMGISVERDIGELPEQVNQSVNICFYRLVQESLSNAFQHAGASSARVSASCSGDFIDVQIEDPGPGFDTESTNATSNSLGLLGLRDRIESLGGVFNLDSAHLTGTRVSARLFVKNMES